MKFKVGDRVVVRVFHNLKGVVVELPVDLTNPFYLLKMDEFETKTLWQFLESSLELIKEKDYFMEALI